MEGPLNGSPEASASSVVLPAQREIPAPVITPFFGMPHALVIIAFLAAAVVLSLFAHMPVHTVYDVLLLLGGAGSVGVAVVLAVAFGERRRGGSLLRRLLNAVLNNGAGS